ncbi:MAG: hypothetical protein GIW94_06645 [Candidatus Eremiobacteraeota bacterium]|nr:hypothetical protein [Candidatus Eremiobacteraeota bacterium]MBC5822760.1 hypothetical protein [Candidatus Eremiobacteraeota bacterium]
MHSLRSRAPGALLAATCVALAACQGNIGNGGLSIPGPPAYNNPQGPGGEGTQSRQRVVEGAVFLAADLKEIPLPEADGFTVAVELGSPAPAASSAAPSQAAGRSPSLTSIRRAARSKTASVAPASVPPSPSSAAPSFGPSPSPSISPAAAPSARGAKPAGSPAPSPSPPKIATKTIAYPDDAPAAPSPEPSGNVQTYGVRKALVRGYVNSATPLDLYGLGAIRFTIPADEQKDGRGFTIALFESGRHHHQSLIAFDADAKLNGSVVSVSDTQPLVLRKDTGYLLMLYGDELPSTPAPLSSGYPSPGNNPFPAPSVSYGPGYPGYPQQPGMPGTPNPFNTPTRYP